MNHSTPSTLAAPKQTERGTANEITTPSLQIPPRSTPGADQPAALSANIARLPKETRDMINVMLDDGLPYHILLEELGEGGQKLTPQSLTDWVQGRYQDYLKNREVVEETKSQIEFATDLIRELGDTDPSVIYRACAVVAAHQIFNAIREYGDEALREALQTKPSTYFNLINSLCNLSDAGIKREEHDRRMEAPPTPSEETHEARRIEKRKK
jgi:hypothetical protein